jgi:tetratricopeptide (TPR) repeat protein
MNPYYSQTNSFSLDARVAVNSVANGNDWFNKGELKKAIEDYSEAILRDPRLAIAYRSRGDAWSRTGEYDKAIADFDEFLRLKPSAADGYYGRGLARLQRGDFDNAIVDLDRAIQLAPGLANACAVRGEVWFRKGEWEKAICDLDESVRLVTKERAGFAKRADNGPDDINPVSPEVLQAYQTLAMILGAAPDDSLRDGKRSVELATTACEMSGWEDVDALESLAVAYAECRQFEDSVKWQEKAIEIDRHDEGLRARLELFRSGEPFRLGKSRSLAGPMGRVDDDRAPNEHS